MLTNKKAPRFTQIWNSIKTYYLKKKPLRGIYIFFFCIWCISTLVLISWFFFFQTGHKNASEYIGSRIDKKKVIYVWYIFVQIV